MAASGQNLDHGCACILLAAGGSRRLGRPKQLLRVDDETLLHRATRLAVESGFAPICVVLGHEADVLQSQLNDFPVLIEDYKAWQGGMAGSLQAGITRLQTSGLVAGHALIMVCDQVGLTAEHLLRLRSFSATQPHRIVATGYGGVRGVPAIFPVSYFKELMSLEGDQGARGLLQSGKEDVVCCNFEMGLRDIDTLEDASTAGLL